MNNILLRLKNFILDNKLTVVLVITLISFWTINKHQQNVIERQKQQIAIIQHNLDAANDSVRIEKLKNNEQQFVKLSFVADKFSTLERANKLLADEVRKMKGEVRQIQKSDIKIVEKEVPVLVKGELIDSTVRTDFNFDTTFSPGNYRTLSGWTKYDLRNGKSSGIITESKIGISLITGVEKINDKYQVFARSLYPGFEITDLQGAVIDPNIFKSKSKKKLITVGLHLGIVPVTYDFKTQKIDLKLTRIGASAGLNINL